MDIGMGTAATIDRAITRAIEATATTDTVRTDIVRTDTDRTGIGRIDVDTVIIEAAVATGASVLGMPVVLTAGPAVDFRFITVVDAFSHPSAVFRKLASFSSPLSEGGFRGVA